MRKTKKEIIDETVAYYSEDPKGRRAYWPGGGCFYYRDGRMCAVGRCLIDPEAVADSSAGGCGIGAPIWGGIGAAEWVTGEVNLEELLKEEYRGHSRNFWRNLQQLHDSHYNWSDFGLSEYGNMGLQDLHDTWDNVPGEEEPCEC